MDIITIALIAQSIVLVGLVGIILMMVLSGAAERAGYLEKIVALARPQVSYPTVTVEQMQEAEERRQEKKRANIYKPLSEVIGTADEETIEKIRSQIIN